LLAIDARRAAVLANRIPNRSASLSDAYIEEGHYTHHPLNDEISRKLLTGYLEILDFSHLFSPRRYRRFHGEIRNHSRRRHPAREPPTGPPDLRRFPKAGEDRIKKIKELVKQPVDFKSERNRPPQRRKSALA
jgi:hypothetical protein